MSLGKQREKTKIPGFQCQRINVFSLLGSSFDGAALVQQ
jgi:hypothetical protein